MLRRLLGIVSLSLIVWSSLDAALVFEQVDQFIPATVGQKEVVATYRFKNTGKETVRLLEPQTSCDCTVAELPRRSYAPGDGGDLRVVSHLGERSGPQNKQTSLMTDLSADPIVLTLRTDIPALGIISPQLVLWEVGDAPTERAVSVQLNPAFGVQLKSLRWLSGGGFTHRIEAGAQAGSMTLYIQPTGTQQRLRDQLELEAEDAHGQHTHWSIYASIR